MALLFAGVLLAIAWFGNKGRLRKVDLDPNDPHTLRVGPTRLRMDWVTGTMTALSEGVEERTVAVERYSSMRDEKGEWHTYDSGIDTERDDVRHERFALVAPGVREEFSFSTRLAANFPLNTWLGQRLTIVWLTVDGQRHYMRFYSHDAKGSRDLPVVHEHSYWQFVERAAPERVWTALPAIAGGWLLFLDGRLVGLAGWRRRVFGLVLRLGMKAPNRSKFERDHLDQLIAKLGAGGQ